MRIMYINNDGGGFADHITIDDGTTVEQLFEARVPDGDPGSYLIRVNRQPSTRDQELQEGDRVSFTPTKIEGAAAGAESTREGPDGFRRVRIWLASIAQLIGRKVRRWRNRRIDG